MRHRSCPAVLFVTLLAACGGDSTIDNPALPDSGGGLPTVPAFSVTSKEVTIDPGQEITYCYYFRTPNTEPVAVHRWTSSMTPGSHHMIMFTTRTDVKPPGTIDSINCGFGGDVQNMPSWTYATQVPEDTLALPTDDGTGKPLAQLIPPNTPAFFQMHYLNATDQPLTVSVTVSAEALAPELEYTATAPYITYNADITIPGETINMTFSKTCDTPANATFWMMSTHAHKRARKTVVKNGMPTSTKIAFESTDWEHPGAKAWMATPFYTFDGDKLTYECTYDNPSTKTIYDGDSAEINEMCMATGYYFVPGRTTLPPALCYCPSGINCILL